VGEVETISNCAHMELAEKAKEFDLKSNEDTCSGDIYETDESRKLFDEARSNIFTCSALLAQPSVKEAFGLTRGTAERWWDTKVVLKLLGTFGSIIHSGHNHQAAT